uniref:GntT/GntP/DsdX family permease n=1 Tax=Roseivirga sp. TaxID=1964215 RepID=UPI0040478DF2
MEELQLIFAIISGIALLLFLIIKLKLNAFLSLLTASIWVGLWGGLSPAIILQSISKGMGDTLAFVATIVGLGAIFGAILEHSGGAQALAKFLLKKGGETKSRLALLITGFIVSIPVFFDVGIIILFPLVKALANRVKKNVLAFALPLLTGLAVTHSFIPPTPGPVAVADILKVDLGYAIVVGLIIGLPVALICGLWLSKYITPAEVTNFEDEKEMTEEYDTSLVKLIFLILGLPIGLILILILAVALAIGLFSGLYPALVMAGFNPVLALKGGVSKSGKSYFRNGLVVFQYALAIAIIIGTVLATEQLNFMQKMDLGFNKEQVVAINMYRDTNAKYELLQTELRNQSEIIDVTATSQSRRDKAMRNSQTS